MLLLSKIVYNVLGFCPDMGLTPCVVFCQLYEVALNAQNTERVKLVTFDGSLGYLHNGLYRDPKLPGILKWAHLLQNILVAAAVLISYCF